MSSTRQTLGTLSLIIHIIRKVSYVGHVFIWPSFFAHFDVYIHPRSCIYKLPPIACDDNDQTTNDRFFSLYFVFYVALTSRLTSRFHLPLLYLSIGFSRNTLYLDNKNIARYVARHYVFKDDETAISSPICADIPRVFLFIAELAHVA